MDGLGVLRLFSEMPFVNSTCEALGHVELGPFHAFVRRLLKSNHRIRPALDVNAVNEANVF